MRFILKIPAAILLLTIALTAGGCADRPSAPDTDGGAVHIVTGSDSPAPDTVPAQSGTDIRTDNEVQAGAEDQTENDIMIYTIKRVSGGPDWSSVPVLSVGNILWEPDCGIRARAQLCYDDGKLYVHLAADEKDIRAEYAAPLSPTYEDSCLEFFFMPESEDRYFNFEINPNGCLYIGFGHGRSDSTTLYREDMQQYFDIRADRTDNGWEVFYSIPLEFLDVFYRDYTFSGTLMANIYKCGDKTERRHYLSWNPVHSEKPDFHRPQDFGKMIFE